MSHIIRFLITGGLVWIFQLIGWISIQTELAPFSTLIANQLLVAGIIGLLFSVAVSLFNFAYGLFVLGSCGFGCLLYPLYLIMIGPVGFWFAELVLPTWFSLETGFWGTVLMGFILSLPQISIKVTTKSSSSRRVTESD